MRLMIPAGVVLIHAVTLNAQQATVQQPATGINSVRTSISVPDRGTVSLGGVGSAQSFRQSHGPMPGRSTFGMSRSANSLSTSVYIHDLRAMDEALLNSVSESPSPTSIQGRATTKSPAAMTASLEDRAEKYERLARQAEAAGKLGVAKLHWQMAAKYGSGMASEKLKSARSLPTASATPVKN